jgi:PAS domain-containing protein
VLEEVGASFEWLPKVLTDIRLRSVEAHHRLEQAVRDRESCLRNLLADCAEAVVVTNDAHRLLAGNRAALSLLGVSRANINRFTIDTFLPVGQIPQFNRPGMCFLRGKERQGECVIR